MPRDPGIRGRKVTGEEIAATPGEILTCRREKDGIETIIEIRQLFPPVSIHVMSGAADNDKLLRLSNAFHPDVTIKKNFNKKHW